MGPPSLSADGCHIFRWCEVTDYVADLSHGHVMTGACEHEVSSIYLGVLLPIPFMWLHRWRFAHSHTCALHVCSLPCTLLRWL